MQRSRNDDDDDDVDDFYVVQFLELPFEGIDVYVCVPYTWIKMRRSRNDELEFYVVQFLELPFEGIDDYVCIPKTWIILHRTAPNWSIVAYPEEKIALIEERVKRKEEYCNNWRFYRAVIKYQSNIYEIAEQWIIESRRNQRPFIERNADNLEVGETRRIPDNMQPASSSYTNSRSAVQGHSLNDHPHQGYQSSDQDHQNCTNNLIRNI
ncbi:unnamed protein product [Colias eurytheme]|nr:unnamed protein product [Colias eurytheme]